MVVTSPIRAVLPAMVEGRGHQLALMALMVLLIVAVEAEELVRVLLLQVKLVELVVNLAEVVVEAELLGNLLV